MINGPNGRILAVIPARYASTRFPGKPLTAIAGKSMIQRVYEQVSRTHLIDTWVVATDDARIFDHVAAFGGRVVMTSAAHPSGTDRCAEVAAAYPDASIVVNVQGDEPFIQPEQIDLLVETLLKNPSFGIATLAKQIEDTGTLFNPNVVKTVFSQSGAALYFSRHPIPYVRGKSNDEWLNTQVFYKHIGLYAFQAPTLAMLAQLPPSRLEIAESLEQLRWLEHGFDIAVGITLFETIGIDTPEDLERITLQE